MQFPILSSAGSVSSISVLLRLLYLLGFGLLCLPAGLAQSSLNVEDVYDSYRPRSRGLALGAHMATQGWGVDVYYFRQMKGEREWFLSFSLALLKDTREAEFSNEQLYENASPFIYDKKNHVLQLSGVYGWQFRLLPLNSYNRLSLRGGIGLGPTLALVKPYYVDVIVQQAASRRAFLESKPYDYESIPRPEDILAPSDFFKGLGEASVVPGIRLRGHLTFNFAGSTMYIRGIQAGGQLDLYAAPIELMDQFGDNSLFLTGYVGFIIGNAW